MKKIFSLLALFVFTQSISQETNYDIQEKDAFQPMFSFGSGYYNSLGDIRGPDGNYLVGNMGINTGIRINLTEDMDLSFLFNFNAKLHETSSTESFTSDLNAIGFNLDYTFNNILENTKIAPFATTGAQWMYYKTNGDPLKTGVNIPLGLGIALDVSERIRFDVGMNYHLSFADIDQATEIANNDNFSVINFTLHYDLFTKKSQEYNYYDESNYKNVNFKAMDVQDADNDGVPDIDDNCPGTPKGVKVSESGCPYDGDNDGVPNHLDQEKNTKPGAVVNEKGIQLTDEEFHSMYSTYEVASREYAKFYNESEIKRDNYNTINDYLIAKANAFNQQYNEKSQDIIIGKRYKIQLMNPEDNLGRFTDNVPSYLVNKILSYENLESLPQNDYYVDNNGNKYTKESAIEKYGENWQEKTYTKFENVVYCIEDFEQPDDAERYMIETMTEYPELETKIVVVENGIVSDYIYPEPEDETEEDTEWPEEEIITDTITKNTDSLNFNDSSVAVNNTDRTSKDTEKIIYRVQVGAYQKELSYDVFKGVNVIPIRTLNMTRYYVGSFTEYEQSLIKRDEMRARGFEDAFIVIFKNGERININAAIKSEKRNNQTTIENSSNAKIIEKDAPNITFYVQIGVWGSEINEEIQSRLDNIGGATKVNIKANLYKYIAGNYKSLDEAEFRLSEVSSNGFRDAFIYAEQDGKRIKVKEAKKLLDD